MGSSSDFTTADRAFRTHVMYWIGYVVDVIFYLEITNQILCSTCDEAVDSKVASKKITSEK